MDNTNNENAGCNCDSGCCKPTKGKLWKKVLFVAILFLAIAIVSVKLIEKNNAKPQIKTDSSCAQQSTCGDTTVIKGYVIITDSTKNKSCCPKPKK